MRVCARVCLRALVCGRMSWVLTGEVRRVCSLAAGASACTNCTAGSYYGSTGACLQLRVCEGVGQVSRV